MLILKACAVCLSTDLKLNDINGQLRQEYNMASDLKTEQCIGMPQHLCIYCTAYVRRFSKFRQKCQLAYSVLKKILDKNKQIQYSHLKALDTNVLGLKPTLSFMDLKNCHEEEIKLQCDNLNCSDVAPIAHSSTHENVFIQAPSQNNFNKVFVLETSTWRYIEEKSSSPKNIDSFNVTNENVSETDSLTENCLQNADEVISIDSDDELFNEEYEEVASVEKSDNELFNEEIEEVASVGKSDNELFNEENEEVASVGKSDNELFNEDNEEVASVGKSDNELFNEENEAVESVEMREESDKTKEESDEIEAEDFKSIVNANFDGCNLEPEYAKMIPLSMLEVKAVSEVYKLCSKGKHRCETCKKCYTTQNRLDVHLRMHNMHVSGSYLCELCHYYYKTYFLLKTHMIEKHMYKYLCRECPEVNYERASAKQHYIRAHLQNYRNRKEDWYKTRPDWINKKGGRRVKGTVPSKPVRKTHKLPQDFLVYSPIRQEDQYLIVNERQNSKNYKTSEFKCEYCFRGYRNINTYNKHMWKHNPASGSFQCDMCKQRFSRIRQVYTHMTINHLHKYTCQHCGFVCYSRKQAQEHYKFHKDVVYPCPHCDKTFKKLSTRFTHVRVSHPSTFICNICGHGFVSENGLSRHKTRAHTKQEVESSALISAEAETGADAKASADAMLDPLYCADCQVRFVSQGAFDTHLRSSGKHTKTNLSTGDRLRRTDKVPVGTRKRGSQSSERGRKRLHGTPSDVHNHGVPMASTCELCLKVLPNDRNACDHYRTVHPGEALPKRYMCDVCGHTTQMYTNLVTHMRRHTNEKPFTCPHCDRTFSSQSNRNRHLLIHTGEKPYVCEICSRRFSEKGGLTLHTKTVHLKIPHPAWDKRKRRHRQADRLLKAASNLSEDTSHNANYLAAFINYSY